MYVQNTSKPLRGIAFLTLILLSQIAFGQTCTEGAGLGNNPFTTGGHSAVGQSFTANCAGGQITVITLVWNSTVPAPDRQLNIYDGPDFNSPVLYTQVIPFGSIVNGPNTFVISPPVPINLGETNSFEITAVGGGTSGGIANGVAYGNNVYAGGQPFWSRGPFPSLDLAFEVELNGAQVQTRAAFVVDFSFDDGNNVAGSVAHISCNGGLPLTNEQNVMDGDTITFVLEFPEEGAGNTDCDIWVDDVSGYTPDYDASGSFSNFDDDSAGCHYFNVDNGDRNYCDVDMDPDTASLTVYKTWDVIGNAGDQVNYEAQISVCSNQGVIAGDFYIELFNQWCVTDTVYGPGTDSFDVTFDGADFQGDNVYIYERSFDDSVEADISGCVSSPGAIGNGQGGFSYEVFNGGSNSCTINNTVYYEGIPTLNQYGLAIMALLMLGIGFVGFRRLT